MAGDHPVRRLALALAAAAALAMSGCVGPAGFQASDEMALKVGDDRRTVPASPHADLFVDYALLADQSYADILYGRDAPAIAVGDDTYCLGRTAPGQPCRDALGLTPYARDRLARWRRVYAAASVDRFPCAPERGGCSEPLPGLGVQVWMRRGRVCPEAVIVFRGTDGRSADDWLSNLRWVLRLLPLHDQYDQVQDHAPAFVAAVERQPCFRRGSTRIVAVGHSLGGGLAETAAYREGRIRSVLSFDPSVVTGRSDLPAALVAANSRGLGIERVYEQGEILAGPRAALEQLAPPPACDPLVRTIRLNALTGDPVAQHSLSSMTTALLAWSKARKAQGLRADAPLPGPRPDSCRSA